jgi:hypothetical protein
MPVHHATGRDQTRSECDEPKSTLTKGSGFAGRLACDHTKDPVVHMPAESAGSRIW